MMLLLLLLVSGLLLPLLVLALLLKAYIAIFGKRHATTLSSETSQERTTIGFFHPYCNAGGGGERVLWCAVRAIQKKYKNVDCVIYTGDVEAKAEDIVQRARNRFNIVLPRAVEFVFLTRRNFVEAKTYPVLTLLGQSLGSVVLGFEALSKFVPDIYIDSMGYAFTLPLFKYVGGCKVACYTHYPTISLDMLSLVSKRTVSYNNQGFVANNPILSRFKVLYYKLFALLYGFVGARADVVMVNSSWTYGHISSLWGKPSCTSVVYPPCDTKEFLSIKGIPDDEKTVKSIVSIAQFRPEKDHKLQIRSFANFLKRLSESEKEEVKLELIGSCRNAEDQSRVDELKALSEELGVNERVDFLLSVPFDVLKDRLANGTMGLHTMWNEHFGIGVVECMAAGTIIIAHNTGGPKLDIVIPYQDKTTGFLASDEAGYADAMEKVFRMSINERQEIREAAKASVVRFSDQEFEISFLAAVESLFA